MKPRSRTWVIGILLGSLALGARALPTPPAGSSYVYPNPGHGCCVQVVYQMEESGQVDVRVYQESGELATTVSDLRPAGVQQSTVLLCVLAPGSYFYRVTLHYDSGRTVTLPTGRFLVGRH